MPEWFNSGLGHKTRAFSPVQHPLEHAAVGYPGLGRTHPPAWSSGASSAGTGGKSPARAQSDRFGRRPCCPHRGWCCRPPRGEAAVTAQPLAPVIPSSGVPLGRQRARAAASRPLARPVRSVPENVAYGIARIDASGRICERAIVTALGWAGGDRLTLTAQAGVVTARRHPGGMVTLPASAYITIPAALRHRCGLEPGDQVLLAALPAEDILAAYCLAVVDQAIRAHGALPNAHGGQP